MRVPALVLAVGLLACTVEGGADSTPDSTPADDRCEVDWDGDGWTPCEGDCDDDNYRVNPGADEPRCSEEDLDCDGSVTSREDVDGDGYGPCDRPADCVEGDPNIYPGAPDVCDGVNTNCSFYEDWEDPDGDGWPTCGDDHDTDADDDCDPGNAGTYPGAPERCDGLDNDCNGSIDDVGDGDGDGSTECEGDCDDADPDRRPGIVESCDGIDEDCDGGIDVEFDADTDGATTCGRDGVVGTPDDDCDDADPLRKPGNLDVDGDAFDSDCDGADTSGLCVEAPPEAPTDSICDAMNWAVQIARVTPRRLVEQVNPWLEAETSDSCRVALGASAAPWGVPEPNPDPGYASWSESFNALGHLPCPDAVGAGASGLGNWSWLQYTRSSAKSAADVTKVHAWIDIQYYRVSPDAGGLAISGLALQETSDAIRTPCLMARLRKTWSTDILVRSCGDGGPSWVRGTTVLDLTGSRTITSQCLMSAEHRGTVTAYADTTPWVAELDLGWFNQGTEEAAGYWGISPTFSVSVHPWPGAPPTSTAVFEPTFDGCGPLAIDGGQPEEWCPQLPLREWPW